MPQRVGDVGSETPPVLQRGEVAAEDVEGPPQAGDKVEHPRHDVAKKSSHGGDAAGEIVEHCQRRGADKL